MGLHFVFLGMDDTAEISVTFVIYHLYHWRHDSPLIYTGCKASLYFEPRLALVHRWVSSVCSWEWMCHPGSHGSYEAELKPPAHQQLTCRQLRPRQLSWALPGSAWFCLYSLSWERTDRCYERTFGRTDADAFLNGVSRRQTPLDFHMPQ